LCHFPWNRHAVVGCNSPLSLPASPAVRSQRYLARRQCCTPGLPTPTTAIEAAHRVCALGSTEKLLCSAFETHHSGIMAAAKGRKVASTLLCHSREPPPGLSEAVWFGSSQTGIGAKGDMIGAFAVPLVCSGNTWPAISTQSSRLPCRPRPWPHHLVPSFRQAQGGSDCGVGHCLISTGGSSGGRHGALRGSID
jgi:hypothetical protein